jgi:hypothetical protein
LALMREPLAARRHPEMLPNKAAPGVGGLE